MLARSHELGVENSLQLAAQVVVECGARQFEHYLATAEDRSTYLRGCHQIPSW